MNKNTSKPMSEKDRSAYMDKQAEAAGRLQRGTASQEYERDMGGAGGPCALPPVAGLAAGISRAVHSLSDLESVISVLEDRLQFVLSPASPTESPKFASAPCGGSEAAQGLEEIHRLTLRQIARLHEITQRAETSRP